MDQQSEQNSQPVQVSVGEALRSARETAGLSLNEVADRLKLSLRQLEAIERDDFGTLPGPTFVRGFVRNYARFLEIDPAPLMEALDAHFPSAVHDVANLARDEHGASSLNDGDNESNSSTWVVLGLVGVVLGATAAWIFGRSNQVQPDLMPVVSQQTASDMTAVTPPTAAAKPVVVKAASAASAQTASAAVAKALKSPNRNASQAQGATGASKVAITVSEPAWVAIVDAQGNKVVYAIVQPGAKHEASGVPPFKVRIGNAAKVTLSYDGKPVDMTDFIHGTTATLELK